MEFWFKINNSNAQDERIRIPAILLKYLKTEQ